PESWAFVPSLLDDPPRLGQAFQIVPVGVDEVIAAQLEPRRRQGGDFRQDIVHAAKGSRVVAGEGVEGEGNLLQPFEIVHLHVARLRKTGCFEKFEKQPYSPAAE